MTRKFVIFAYLMCMLSVTGCSDQQIQVLRTEYSKAVDAVEQIDEELDGIKTDIQTLRAEGYTEGPKLALLIDQAFDKLDKRDKYVSIIKDVGVQLETASSGWEVAGIGAEALAGITGIPGLAFLGMFLRARGQRNNLIRNVELSRAPDTGNGMIVIDRTKLTAANESSGLNPLVKKLTTGMKT